jgi:hypothetical protein
MLDRAAKTFFQLLAGSGTLKTLASRYGMRRTESFARRFIAGEWPLVSSVFIIRSYAASTSLLF